MFPIQTAPKGPKEVQTKNTKKKEKPLSEQNQTKEEFIVSCVGDGVSREICEERWNASHEINPAVTPAKPSPGDSDLLRKIEMLEAQLKTREKQLRQAIDIAGRANDERKAKEEAEKQSLISSIVLDSKFSKDDLAPKSLSELQTIRLTLDKSLEKTFANVAAQMDAAFRKQKPQLTAGYYDNEQKKWVGGI